MNSRPKTIGIWFLIVVMLALLLTPPAADLSASVTKSTERGSYFFRLKAKYTHEGQPIDFDIVVACNIRVDHYRGGESGFLATRYPSFFFVRTHDNHSVMQIIPNACRGESTADGRVPDDFLPSAIWFDKPGDYRFGIGYVSEDAFENPNSQLTFHGASIEEATLEEWEEFRKRTQDNDGFRKRYFGGARFLPETARRIASARGKEIDAAVARVCRGVARHKLSEAGRAVVRMYWPKNQPRFWATEKTSLGPWPELKDLERSVPILASGLRYIEHIRGGSYKYGGFATRLRGGMINSHSRPKTPSEIFPTRFDHGIPWVFSDEVAKSKFLTKHIEVKTGPGKGFLYCYTALNRAMGVLEIPIPNFREREARVQVDGEWVVTPKPRYWHWANPFFERDEYIYFEFVISLS